MRKVTKKYIEQLLKDYPTLEKEIKTRRAELIHDRRKYDDLNANRRSNRHSDPTQAIVITLDQDAYLTALERTYNVIKGVIEELPEDEKEVIRRRYFKAQSELWDKIALETYYSVKSCYKIRDDVCKKIAIQLGMY